MNALNIGAAVCSCISLLFLLLALGSNNWIEHPIRNHGLWKSCIKNICGSYIIESLPAYMHATRAFMILGMIAGAVSLGGLCTMFSQSKVGNISMGLISYIASFTAGLCVLIAMSVFSGQSESDFFGWSFALGWTSFPLYLITGGLAWKLHIDTAVSA